MKIIQSMYDNNVLRVKIGKDKISNNFAATIGVRKGDSLSRNLFNMFTNNLVDVLIVRHVVLSVLVQHTLLFALYC